MPEQDKQGILFDGLPGGEPAPAPEDIDEVAKRIAANPLVSKKGIDEVYDKEPSEAAINQGWGLQPVTPRPRLGVASSGRGNAIGRRSAGNSRRVAGPLRGDSEGDSGGPAYHEEHKPLDGEEAKRGKRGLKAAKAILRAAQPPQPRR